MPLYEYIVFVYPFTSQWICRMFPPLVIWIKEEIFEINNVGHSLVITKHKYKQVFWGPTILSKKDHCPG